MKNFLFVLFVPLVLSTSGCSTAGMARLARELGRDQATVNVSVQSVYGTLKFVRTNPGTNSTVTVSPDGTVTIKRE